MRFEKIQKGESEVLFGRRGQTERKIHQPKS